MSKVLITGGSGTVGSGLFDGYKDKMDITIIDRSESIFFNNHNLIKFDLASPFYGFEYDFIGKHDVVVHLAANARVHQSFLNPDLALENYISTHRALELAKNIGAKRFIFTSSREVYGDRYSGRPLFEFEAEVGYQKSPYAASKLGSESLVSAFCETNDMEYIILRLSNVYGNYDYSERAVPYFCYLAQRDLPIKVFGGDEKILDFTHQDDCSFGIFRAINTECGLNSTYNLSSGCGTKLSYIAKEIVGLMKSNSDIILADNRIGEVHGYAADISKAGRYLDYTPSTRIELGINSAVNNFNLHQTHTTDEYQKKMLNDAGYQL